ncbi:MAG: 50S ribosomal protein L27 [Candidatus Niyogibacteria bacterium]|nr:50S ribosomal protein L27 [Candidatus Niyogibacteria bacterium]
MAHTKAGGTAKNLRDSKPKYLGIKLSDGSHAKPGAIIIRQRGSEYVPGKNVRMGKDHTLFAVTAGIVKFASRRRIRFDRSVHVKRVINVV